MRQVLRSMLAGFALATVPVHAAVWEEAVGPHATTVVANAGPEGKYYIQRPRVLAPNAHPIVVLLGGTGSYPKDYDALLAGLASHGVVAIAVSDAYQADGTKASAALDWLLGQNEARDSDYFGKLVPSRVLAIGHSSGGSGAVSAAIVNPRITSVLLYAPGLSSGRVAELSVPAFFIAGSLDNTNTPADVKARFQEMTKASAWYGESANQGHIGFARNSSVQYFTRAWVYTQLFADAGTARDCFYGPKWSFNHAPGWNETLKNDSAP